MDHTKDMGRMKWIELCVIKMPKQDALHVYQQLGASWPAPRG